MNFTDLSQELIILKQSTIGLVIDGTRIEMLLDYDNIAQYIKTAFITDYLALQTYQGIKLPKQRIHLFPYGQSLYDMLKDPYEWDKWLKSLKSLKL